MIGYSEIIIPTQLKNELLRSVKNRRVPNTILFTGVNGGAALGLALALAKHMACEATVEEGSCNICPTCLQFNHFNYPDLHLSFPFSKSKSKQADPSCAEFRPIFTAALEKSLYLTQERWLNVFEADNQQLTITVGEAKAISKELSIKGFSNKPRFVLIWQPELLNSTTANKLLKTIEEPGENVFIFLVSHKPKSILGTILSRCITIKIPPNTAKETDLFILKHKLSSENISHVLLNSVGSFGLALDLLNDGNGANLSANYLVRWLRILYSKDLKQIILWSEDMATKTREEIRFFLVFSITVFRQTAHLNHNSLTVPPFEHDTFDVKKFSPFIKPEDIPDVLSCLQKSHDDILRNGNAKTVILDTSLQLFKYIGQA